MRFWTNPAKFRAFVGGIGSGKTRAGCVEALRMPANTHGMIVAPTYPMLRDATLRTFLELAGKGEIIKGYNKSEMAVDLIDGKRILFRSGDDADRLRGPNLGWFYLDEAAMMQPDVWMIMIGRLREAPGRAWATSTPRGFNWLYEVFHTASEDYAVITSSTRQNPYLPGDFVQSLERAYTSEFARQEIDGEFVEPSGTLFKREWFRIVPTAPAELRWVRYWDLAASTKTSADYTASAAVALHDGTLYIKDMIRGRWEWPDAKRIIVQTMRQEPKTEHLIEEAMHGLAAIQELRRDPQLAAITLRGIHVDKDKQSRALPWAARAEAGKVALIRGDWVPAFLDEVSSFPLGQHDDQVDTVSGGVAQLAQQTGGFAVRYA
jgi:predicted phage terminase large subunit-like protein